MDPEQKKISLRNISYGVYVMTVKSDNIMLQPRLHGFRRLHLIHLRSCWV